jgi:hypothetical protein
MDPEIACNQKYHDHDANDSKDIHFALLRLHDDGGRFARTPYLSDCTKLRRHSVVAGSVRRSLNEYKSLLSPPPISPIAAPSEEQKEHEYNKNEVHSFLQNILWEFSLLTFGCRVTNRQPRILPTCDFSGLWGKVAAEMPMPPDLTDQDGLPRPAATHPWIIETVRRIELDFRPTPGLDLGASYRRLGSGRGCTPTAANQKKRAVSWRAKYWEETEEEDVVLSSRVNTWSAQGWASPCRTHGDQPGAGVPPPVSAFRALGRGLLLRVQPRQNLLAEMTALQRDSSRQRHREECRQHAERGSKRFHHLDRRPTPSSHGAEPRGTGGARTPSLRRGTVPGEDGR